MTTNKKRYQKCTWLEKRWRDRWLLWAPIKAIYCWVHDCIKHPSEQRECFLLYWDISLGMADCEEKRNYWYSMEECCCMEFLDERITKEQLIKILTRKLDELDYEDI